MPEHPLGPPTAQVRADYRSLERKILERVAVAVDRRERTLILVEIEAREGAGGEVEPRIYSSVPYAPAARTAAA